MSIADKLTQLNTIRTSIRNSLTSKLEYDVSEHDFSDFASDIDSIVAGGGGQFKHGIFTLTNANQVTISDVGFFSDVLIVYNDPAVATNSYRTECCYVSQKATGRFSKNFGVNATSARRNQDMPNTLAGYINEVTDTGFKFKPFNANYATAATGTYYYVAIKLAE